MSNHEFTVERVAVGSHEHGYQAVESCTGAVIPLPIGGGLLSTGKYPEIQAHLEAQDLKPVLVYTPRRGDTLNWDAEKSCYIWTFKTGGFSIVVRDPPRVTGAAEVATLDVDGTRSLDSAGWVEPHPGGTGADRSE